MTSIKRVGAWSVVGILCFAGSVRAQAPAFTEAQSAAGRSAYRQRCASCHGAELQGEHLAPALTGERFDRTWRGKPAGALMFQLRRMPPNAGAAGSLGDETYASLLAYLLQANGFEPSTGALPADVTALASVMIPPRAGAASDPVAPVVASAAGAARLAGLGAVSDGMLRNPQIATGCTNAPTTATTSA